MIKKLHAVAEFLPSCTVVGLSDTSVSLVTKLTVTYTNLLFFVAMVLTFDSFVSHTVIITKTDISNLESQRPERK